MSCVVTNKINCDHVRSIKINLVNLDGSVTTVVLYFDVTTGDPVSKKDAEQCPNIQPLTFSCALLCKV